MSRLEKLSAKIQFLEQERDECEDDLQISDPEDDARDAEMAADLDDLEAEVERLEAVLRATMAKWSRLAWAELERG